ncbi:MAG: hypothetical protein ABH885_00785 [Candidatus Omnitrophota bacterium]
MYERFDALRVLDGERQRHVGESFRQRGPGDTFEIDAAGNPVPHEELAYGIIIHNDAFPREVLEKLEALRDEVDDILPSGVKRYKVNDLGLHITVSMIEDVIHGYGRAGGLSPVELRWLFDALAGIVRSKHGFKIRLEGLRIGADGGVIAVWKDSGQLREIREEFYSHARILLGEKRALPIKPREIIHTTLIRILTDVDSLAIERLKDKMAEYRDLSGEGIVVSVNKFDIVRSEQRLAPDSYRKIEELRFPEYRIVPRESDRRRMELAKFLAQRDNLPAEVDCIVAFGNEYLETVFEAARHYLYSRTDTVIFAGGRGHSTANLVAEAGRYLGVNPEELEYLPEAEIMRMIFRYELWKVGLKPDEIDRVRIYCETESRNCGENVTKTEELIAREGIKADSMVLIHMPPLQRRTGLTYLRQAPRCASGKVKIYNQAAFIPDFDMLRGKNYAATLVEEAKKLEEYSKPRYGFTVPLNIAGDQSGRLPENIGKLVYSIERELDPGRFVEANGVHVADHIAIGTKHRTSINEPVQVESGAYRAGSSFSKLALYRPAQDGNPARRYEAVLHLKTGKAVVSFGDMLKPVEIRAGDMICLYADSDVTFTEDSEYLVTRQTDASVTQVVSIERIDGETPGEGKSSSVIAGGCVIADVCRDADGCILGVIHRKDMLLPSRMAMITPKSAAIGVGVKFANGHEDAHRHERDGRGRMEMLVCRDGSILAECADRNGSGAQSVNVSGGQALITYPGSSHGFTFDNAKIAVVFPDPARGVSGRSDKVPVEMEQRNISVEGLLKTSAGSAAAAVVFFIAAGCFLGRGMAVLPAALGFASVYLGVISIISAVIRVYIARVLGERAGPVALYSDLTRSIRYLKADGRYTADESKSLIAGLPVWARKYIKLHERTHLTFFRHDFFAYMVPWLGYFKKSEYELHLRRLSAFLSVRDPLPEQVDAMIVFGNKYIETAFEAARLCLEKDIRLVIFSGGTGDSIEALRDAAHRYLGLGGDGTLDTLSEAEIMDLLFHVRMRALDVDINRINRIETHCDKLSRNCQENVENSRDIIAEIMRRKNITVRNVVLVQQPVPQRRIGLTFDRWFLSKPATRDIRGYNHAAFIPDDDRIMSEEFAAFMIDEAEKLEVYAEHRFGYIAPLDLKGAERGRLPREIRESVDFIKESIYPHHFVRSGADVVASHIRVGERARTSTRLPIQVESGSYRKGASFTGFSDDRHQCVIYLKTGSARVEIKGLSRPVFLGAGDMISIFAPSDITFTEDSDYVVFRQVQDSPLKRGGSGFIMQELTDLKGSHSIKCKGNEIAEVYRNRDNGLLAVMRRNGMHMPAQAALITPKDAAIGICVRNIDGRKPAHRHERDGEESMEITMCVGGSAVAGLANIHARNLKTVRLEKDELLLVYPGSFHRIEYLNADEILIMTDTARRFGRSDTVSTQVMIPEGPDGSGPLLKSMAFLPGFQLPSKMAVPIVAAAVVIGIIVYLMRKKAPSWPPIKEQDAETEALISEILKAYKREYKAYRMSHRGFRLSIPADRYFVLEGVAGMFGVDDNRVRYAKAYGILKAVAHADPGTRADGLERIVAGLRNFTHAGSGAHRFAPLSLALVGAFKGRDVFDRDTAAELAGLGGDFSYLVGKYPMFANPRGIEAGNVPDHAPCLRLARPGAKERYRWLDVGSAPRNAGAPTLNLIRRAFDECLSASGRLEMCGTDVYFPMYRLSDSGEVVETKAFRFDPNGRCLTDINGVDYYNATVPRNDVTSEDFDMGKFDFISMCFVLHHLLPEGEKIRKTTLADLHLVDESGRAFSGQYWLSPTQRRAVGNMLGSLALNGTLFLTMSQSHVAKPLFVGKERWNSDALDQADLFIVIQRTGENTFTVYDTAIPMTPNEYAYPADRFLLGPGPDKGPTIYRNMWKTRGIKGAYPHESEAFYNEVRDLLKQAELAVYRFQKRDRSMYGRVYAAKTLINKGGNLTEVFEEYLRDVPFEFKAGILRRVRELDSKLLLEERVDSPRAAIIIGVTGVSPEKVKALNEDAGMGGVRFMRLNELSEERNMAALEAARIECGAYASGIIDGVDEARVEEAVYGVVDEIESEDRERFIRHPERVVLDADNLHYIDSLIGRLPVIKSARCAEQSVYEYKFDNIRRRHEAKSGKLGSRIEGLSKISASKVLSFRVRDALELRWLAEEYARDKKAYELIYGRDTFPIRLDVRLSWHFADMLRENGIVPESNERINAFLKRAGVDSVIGPENLGWDDPHALSAVYDSVSQRYAATNPGDIAIGDDRFIDPIHDGGSTLLQDRGLIFVVMPEGAISQLYRTMVDLVARNSAPDTDIGTADGSRLLMSFDLPRVPRGAKLERDNLGYGYFVFTPADPINMNSLRDEIINYTLLLMSA